MLVVLGVSAQAPSGFRAAPRAVFAVTAIRLQSLTPSRLRAYGAARCACLRGKPCGLSPPRDAWRPSIPPNRLRRIGPASAPPCGGALANTPEFAAAGCANACCPQRWQFVPITSRRTVHGQPARHCYGDSTPRLKTSPARCGGGILACRWVVDLARVSGRAGAAFMRGCRVGHISLRCGSAQGVLVLL